MFFWGFFGEHKFRVELHGNLRPGTSLITMERVTFSGWEWSPSVGGLNLIIDWFPSTKPRENQEQTQKIDCKISMKFVEMLVVFSNSIVCWHKTMNMHAYSMSIYRCNSVFYSHVQVQFVPHKTKPHLDIDVCPLYDSFYHATYSVHQCSVYLSHIIVAWINIRVFVCSP